MNFSFIPTLQHMTAAKIALCIYYDNELEKKLLEIRKKIPLVKKGGERRWLELELWKLIERKTAEKLPSLPDLLKRRVSKFIKPIHSERIRWFRDHKVKDLPALAYKNELCWKNDGSIDRTQTAKKIAQNKNIDPEIRFEMACTYFLEDEVLALWHRDINIRTISQNRTNSALRFWVQRLKRRSRRKMSWKAEIDEYFQNLRVQDLYIPVRICCFFPYLSWEGKKKCLRYLMLSTGHVDDLVSCLRTMDQGELVETVTLYRTNILLCLLIWPFQHLFIDVAKQLWSHMTFDLFDNILKTIVMNANADGFEDFDYAELLKDFWHLSSDSYKRRIRENETLFKMIETTLNYDGQSASPSLPEAMQES